MSDLVHVRIDGREVAVERDTTILQAATDLGIEIPTLCHHPALEPYGACRLCTVEVVDRGRSKLVTSCNYPIRSEIEVITSSERVVRGRRMIVELLWARCAEAEVFQALGASYGIPEPRFELREGELCYLCGLCVRFCNEVVGAKAISLVSRGVEREVGTPFYKVSEACIACGACEYVCPTGAIKVTDVTDKEPRPLLLDFDMNLRGRGNIYIPFPQAVPNRPVIDREHCLHFQAGTCGVCSLVCPPGAVDYEQEDEFIEVDVGTVVVATGYDLYSLENLGEYGHGQVPDVIDALAMERLLSASGPTSGVLERPSDGKEPKRWSGSSAPGRATRNWGCPTAPKSAACTAPSRPCYTSTRSPTVRPTSFTSTSARQANAMKNSSSGPWKRTGCSTSGARSARYSVRTAR